MWRRRGVSPWNQICVGGRGFATEEVTLSWFLPFVLVHLLQNALNLIGVTVACDPDDGEKKDKAHSGQLQEIPILK